MQKCSLISEGVNLSEYRIRVVSDIESFVEKVQIISAGYDDRAIEVMKYMNSPLEDGDIQFNYEHMVFTKVGQESYQFMFIDIQIVVASLDFSQEKYEYYLADVEDLETNTYYIDSRWAESFLVPVLHKILNLFTSINGLIFSQVIFYLLIQKNVVNIYNYYVDFQKGSKTNGKTEF